MHMGWARWRWHAPRLLQVRARSWLPQLMKRSSSATRGSTPHSASSGASQVSICAAPPILRSVSPQRHPPSSQRSWMPTSLVPARSPLTLRSIRDSDVTGYSLMNSQRSRSGYTPRVRAFRCAVSGAISPQQRIWSALRRRQQPSTPQQTRSQSQNFGAGLSGTSSVRVAC